MSPVVRVLHTSRTITTGGREQGAARSFDGLLDIRLAPPGGARMGATPEQLFAVAWSASLESAISAAARQRKVAFADGLVIEAAVALCVAGDACFLRAHLDVSLPGVDRDVAQTLLDDARQVCVYCRATRGNIDVAISLV